MGRERIPTMPEAPRCAFRSAPGVPGLRLPPEHADHPSLQPGEDVQGWFDRVFTMFGHRLDRLERRVSRSGRQTLLAAILPSILWALLTLYAIHNGASAPPMPVAPAKAATP